jgi:peptidoglycan/xylan/chitin deacetylase (PgdA/CDA1 family)
VTFDDGYSDVYRHAYPLLRRKGIPAALFVVTGLVDTGRPQVFDRLYLLLRYLENRGLPLGLTVARALQSTSVDTAELRRLLPLKDEPFSVMTTVLNTLPRHHVDRLISALENYVSINKDLLDDMTPLTWEMVETMHRGGMTMGSHTKTHLLLTAETEDVARRELNESKQLLESRLKAPVQHFAYPDGRFNPSVVHAVEGAGYAFAYGICPSRDPNHPLLTIPRKVLWERSCVNALGRFSSAVMNCQTHGAFDLSGRCGHDHVTVREKVTHGTNC